MSREFSFYEFIQRMCVDHPNINMEEKIFDSKNYLPELAESFKFGRIVLSFSSARTLINPDGDKTASIIYDGPDFDPYITYSYDCLTPEGGNFGLTFYAIPGSTWDENDKKALSALSALMYTVYGKSRIGELLDRAISIDKDTHLNNMQGFLKRVGGLEVRGELSKYAVFFLNIKNFRMFNRREGSVAADKLIIDYFKSLSSFIKDDELCARPGGDNAALLIKKERVKEVIEQIKSISIPLVKNGSVTDVHVDTWGGIYEIPDNCGIQDALSYASIALTTAKKNHINDTIQIYTDEMMEAFTKEREILAVLPIALKNREFVVYYQPKANVRGKRLAGAEGLVRWVKDGEIIPPMDFVPILEDDGQIVELDFYVLEQVCKDLRDWLDRGIDPVRISTNFSRDHFLNENTVERILSTLEKYNIDGKYIQIEITEMSGYDNLAVMLEFIKKLHDVGITVAIDDFGIGYSSLNLLKDYEADMIKIDKSLLDDVGDNQKARMLLEYIIKMSHEIGMDVVGVFSIPGDGLIRIQRISAGTRHQLHSHGRESGQDQAQGQDQRQSLLHDEFLLHDVYLQRTPTARFDTVCIYNMGKAFCNEIIWHFPSVHVIFISHCSHTDHCKKASKHCK